MQDLVVAILAIALVYFVFVVMKRDARDYIAEHCSWHRLGSFELCLGATLYFLLLCGVAHVYDVKATALVFGYFSLPLLPLWFLDRGPVDTRRDFIIGIIFALLIWLPIELNWVKNAWGIIYVSTINRNQPSPFGYYLAELSAIAYVLLISAYYRFRGFIYLRCDLRDISWENLRIGGRGYIIAFCLLVPITLLTGFTHLGMPQFRHPVFLPLIALGIFLAPAFAEELLFRDLFQNLFTKQWGWRWGIASASLLFGLSHANNPSEGFAVPNWPYVGFSTVAGFVYGWVYMKTKSSIVSALVHAAVDLTWILFLRGGKFVI